MSQLEYGYQPPVAGPGLRVPANTQFASLSNYGVPAPAEAPSFGNYSFEGLGNRGGLNLQPSGNLGLTPPAPGVGNGFGGSNVIMGSPTGPAATPPSGWMYDSGMLGTRDQQGWGGLALGAAQGIGSLYLGMQQYNLAKDALANNKSQFERNFAAQKTTTNASLEDRQRARVASNGGAYQSVGDYMSQNGIK